MPGKSRFSGGSLLGGVQPLPDDEEEPPPARQLAAAPAPRPPEPEPEPEPEPAAELERAPAPAPKPAAEGSRRGQGPPATLRVNDVAGRALWEAYLVEKAADPFLSYREYASRVVLAGLGKERRRRR